MPFKEYDYYDDMSGVEMTALINMARQEALAIQEELVKHDIHLVDIAQETSYHAQGYGSVMRTALGFASQEDLAMARLLLGRTH